MRDRRVLGEGVVRVPRPGVENSLSLVVLQRNKEEMLGKGACGGVMTHLGQQAAQLSLSLQAPQTSCVGTGHIYHQVVSQGAQDANALYIVCSSIRRSLILPQVYS